MTKQEFFSLVKKYVEGKTSEKERILLMEWYEKLQSNDFMASWSLNEEEEARVRLLTRISATIKKAERQKEGEASLKKIWSAAAIFIGLIISGYFYLQYTSETQNTFIPEGAITLELQDGSIEIIEEDGSTKVLDENGEVIGHQTGSKLVYGNTDISANEELVYNVLTVPYGKSFQLELSDGSTAHLNSGSSVRYPVQFLKDYERQVFISGEAYLDVAKDERHPFIVNAGELNIRVLGTQFNVLAYPEDETTEIVLVEGLVSLYGDNEVFDETSKNALLEPGYKASFDKKEKSISQNAVPTRIYTSWRNGELVFRDMTFENILKKLERRYDVSIINTNIELSQEKFQASFGELPPIEVVLDELKVVYDIQYTINGKNIEIK